MGIIIYHEGERNYSVVALDSLPDNLSADGEDANIVLKSKLGNDPMYEYTENWDSWIDKIAIGAHESTDRAGDGNHLLINKTTHNMTELIIAEDAPDNEYAAVDKVDSDGCFQGINSEALIAALEEASNRPSNAGNSPAINELPPQSCQDMGFKP